MIWIAPPGWRAMISSLPPSAATSRSSVLNRVSCSDSGVYNVDFLNAPRSTTASSTNSWPLHTVEGWPKIVVETGRAIH